MVRGVGDEALGKFVERDGYDSLQPKREESIGRNMVMMLRLEIFLHLRAGSRLVGIIVRLARGDGNGCGQQTLHHVRGGGDSDREAQQRWDSLVAHLHCAPARYSAA